MPTTSFIYCDCYHGLIIDPYIISKNSRLLFFDKNKNPLGHRVVTALLVAFADKRLVLDYTATEGG